MPLAAALLLAVLAAPKPTGAVPPDRVQAAIDFVKGGGR